MIDNSRMSERFQFENSEQVDFILTDISTSQTTTYCICNDFSKVGALLISDTEFLVGQQLTLSIQIENKLIEKLPVTVVRAISDLCDEERYCAAVVFDKPSKVYHRLQQALGAIAA